MSILNVYILGFPPILVTWNCYSFPLFLYVASVIKRLSFVSVELKKKRRNAGISESDRYYEVSFNWISAFSSQAKKGLVLWSKAWRYIVFCVGIKRKNLPPVQGNYFSLF